MLSYLFIWNTGFFIHLISSQRHEVILIPRIYMSQGYIMLMAVFFIFFCFLCPPPRPIKIVEVHIESYLSVCVFQNCVQAIT